MSITAAQRAAFNELRGKYGYSLVPAMRSAKSPAVPEIEFQDCHGYGDCVSKAKVKQDGYTCFIRVHIDTDADTSYLGEFSDTPEDGAIRHSEDSREYAYFNPANVEQWTSDNRFDKTYRSLGLARHDLRLFILKHDAEADYRLMLNLESYWISVKCQRAGVVLGEASLSGIDVDSRDYQGTRKYINETAWELVQEAIAEAEQNTAAKIAELRSTADQLEQVQA